MDFCHYDLNWLSGGETIEVSISIAANVCLMDDFNFIRYQSNNSFSYYGGYATYSPYRIGVPYSGHWHVTIDLGGNSGYLSHNCRVIKSRDFTNEEWNSTWDGKPAKRYPNRKDPDHFTDILYGGSNGNIPNDGHGHVIIENSTSKIVFHRDINGNILVWDKTKCP